METNIRLPGDNKPLPQEQIMQLQRSISILSEYVEHAYDVGAYKNLRGKNGKLNDITPVRELIALMLSY